jgi:hypothetical protein
VLVYNNTFLSEVHQMGRASNLHFRNNLILGQGAWAEVFSIETFTPWSSSDFNGFAAAAAGPSLFAWAAPAAKADYTAKGERPAQSFPTLKACADRTGQDSHSRMIDWSTFRKASAPSPGDATRIYRPEDHDFSLAAGSLAIDAGVVLPGVTDGYEGKAPDLGALESGRPMPTYGPRPLAASALRRCEAVENLATTPVWVQRLERIAPIDACARGYHESGHIGILF